MEHHFNVELASVLGIEKAVIIHNLYFWINHNAKNKVHIHDGSVWTFNSSSAFAKLFPYIKERTISRYLVELEKSNIILTGNYNANSFDKTKWYAFSVPFLSELEKLGYDITDIDICQNVQFDTHKMANGETQNGETIPVSKQDNNKEERDKSLSKKDANADVDEFVDRMYALYPAKCPKRGAYLGKSQKDKAKIKSLLKTYSESDIEFVIRWEIAQKYNKAYMLNFSTFLNNFPDPTQIEGYNESTNTSTNTLPKGWTQERYDMYIRNGYTITEDGRLFKDGKEYK